MTVLFGLGGGGAAVLFHLAHHALFQVGIGELARLRPAQFLVGSLLVILVASLLVGWLLESFCRVASGSGIPQAKVAFWKESGYIPWRVVWVKFVAGVLSLGGGCSLGREGPSVQMAAGLSSNLAGLMGEPKQRRREATAAGAAAGLAAAFNSPLAAITFVLEEIVTDLNSRLLGSVLFASVLGAFVVHATLGKQPAFTLGEVGTPSWLAYLLVPAVAAVASLIGVAFQAATLGLRARRKSFVHVPGWMRPAMGGLITWVLGAAVFLGTGYLGVFGLGYQDLSAGLMHQLPWKIAGILLVAKWAATVACYGFGGCGGIFSPTLFFGGTCGVFLAGLSSSFFHLGADEETLLAVVGMSACLGAVVRAPITSILIVFEMTHEFSLVPPLMVAAMISQVISRWLVRHNFYEALLEQDGHNLEHLVPPRDLSSWHSLPVSAIARFQPVMAESLEPEALRALLKAHPYNAFPVKDGDRVQGILRRREIENALQQNRAPRPEPAVWCTPQMSIRRLQHLMLDSLTGMVLVEDQPGGRVIGLLTLHDLLRAEVAMAEAVRGAD